MVVKQKLKDIYKHLIIWEDWKNNYNHFVPKFIKEAVTGNDWNKWDQNVFNEFFHRSSGQCVSSLRQGYFTRSEQEKIKNNWQELAPLLQKIALSQHDFRLNEYVEIKRIIRKYTELDRRAATNRLIAALQPQLLSTVVNENKIDQLFTLLSTHVSHFDLEWKSNWFENSHQILQFFKKELNQNDGFEILTLPWQVFEEFDPNTIIKYNDMSEVDIGLNEYLNILEYKKQIILQGPPGTGKTRLAKEIAQELTKANINDSLTKEDIIENCRNRISIPAAKTKLTFVILGINESGVKVENSEGKGHTASYQEIISMYMNMAWEKEGVIVNGTQSYSAAIAKFLHSKIDKTISSAGSEYCKIIQFHPSYAYEDFVRGIVAESKGDKVEYKNVNKILGAFAKEALKNYLDSQKESTELTEEVQLKRGFDEFVESLEEELEQNQAIALTDKVSIVDVEEDAFRYKGGSGWTELGNRMTFKDILRSYIDKNTTRQDIKHNSNLSGLAKQHSSYFIRVVNKFRTFFDNKNEKSDEAEIEKVALQKYILIIDEINRANLSSVLGELIYALEYRGKAVESMYEVEGSNKLTLPPNLYIIGTMNTADRSVGHIDYAIRRRFAFVDVLPKVLQDDEEIYFNTEAFQKVAALFNDDNVSKEFERDDVQIGHSYFIVKKKDAESEAKREELFNLKMQYEVKPILFEYERDGILVGTYEGKPIKDYIKSL